MGLLLLVAAIHGWHRGFLTRGIQLIGLIGGGALAYHFAPRLLTSVSLLGAPSVARSMVLVFATIAGGLIGDSLMRLITRRIENVSGRSAVDRLFGALANVLVWAFVIWFAVTATRPVQSSSIASDIAESRILSTIDSHMPNAPRQWASRLANSLNMSRFPAVFNGIAPAPSSAGSAPDRSATTTSGVDRAAASIVRVLSDSTTCGDAEGSGWVVADHRVVTNAHVVAGAQQVVVQREGVGARLRAQVVAFDPQQDLAVLDVPDLTARPLTRAGALATGQSAAVAGFPLNGSYTVVPARVQDEFEATGRNIYSSSTVTRQIYALDTVLEPGNSGGPLLTTSGEVAGTVFAKSTTSADTGYALTTAETASLLDKASSLVAPVSTQACITG